jgi:hypothetical protein
VDAVKIDSAQNVTVSAGNLVIGTSGKGIDFSATPGTGTSELLADYEEGTWTPTATPGTSGSITMDTGSDAASYTVIGRAVYCQIVSLVSSVSTPVGTYVDFSLPFAAGSLPEISGNSTWYTPLGTGVVQSGTSIIRVYMNASTITGGTYLQFSFFYFV